MVCGANLFENDSQFFACAIDSNRNPHPHPHYIYVWRIVSNSSTPLHRLGIDNDARTSSMNNVNSSSELDPPFLPNLQPQGLEVVGSYVSTHRAESPEVRGPIHRTSHKINVSPSDMN